MSRSTVSRSAAMARRSAAEIRPAVSSSRASSDGVMPSLPRPSAADQRAMDDEVGVAADRRGEMRVAPQIEAEMADIVRRIFGLALRAQHHLVDQLLVVGALDALQDLVELRGPQLRAAGQRQADGLQELAQRFLLGERGPVVDAVDQPLPLGLQRFGRCDIGLDHEFFDELVRVEPVGHDDAVDRAVGLEQDLALGQVELERLARIAAALQHLVGGPQRLQHRVEDRPGRVVGRAVDRRLRLRIGELGRRAHHDAVERMPELAAVRRKGHAHGEGRAVLLLAAASRDRWRCAPAASARRGRGNRPNCRASAPRGRARNPAAHRRRHRRSRPWR